MDDLTEQLQSKVFRNLVDLADVRNCRLVSKKWKRIVMSACRDKFHVVYPLTDCTLHTAHKLKDALISFDIYSFTGEGNNKVWSTSGIELLLRTTEWLLFSGSEVSPSEIRKILSLASDSLKTLSFKCLKKNLMLLFLEMQVSFMALRKISIGYYSSKKNNDALNTFTSTLEKWVSLECKVQLPLLEALTLYFDGKSENGQLAFGIVNTKDLFLNYLAIAKLLLKFRQTLREVQIERYFGYFVKRFIPRLFQPEWTEMERGLEALDELNLNRLKVSTMTGRSPLEIEVLGRPKNLKNMLFQNLIYTEDEWHLLFATLKGFNNVDSSNLTSLKISSSELLKDEDPTLAINFGMLKECRNLRTLWLKVNSNGDMGRLFVRNIELLSKGISSLRFEHTERDRYFGEEILLNEQQIRWIIDNLRELESFWISLLIPIPVQTNDNINNEQIEAAEEDNDDAQAQQQENINRLANINLDTFRDLMTMPKLKDARLDMMEPRAFAEILVMPLEEFNFPLGQAHGLGTTLNVVREYSDLSNAAGYTTTTTTSPNFGPNEMFGIATLTIQRNQN